MPAEALFRDDRGVRAVPETDAQWDEWVSASQTRNHALGHPLIDWLECHGEAHGFTRDAADERTDFGRFIMDKGLEFERAVIGHLRGLTEVRTILPEGARSAERRDPAAAEATFAALAEGVPIVCQGVLRDAETRTWGAPDLLVRSDLLAELFPDSLSASDAAIPAPDLGIGARHYRVVDVKYATLGLAAGGELGNSGSAPAYKVQTYLYNRALGRLQGYRPSEAFLLGRGWTQTRRGETSRGDGALDRLGPVADGYASYVGGRLADQAAEAVAWLRRMRREGHGWHPLPEPSVEELRPNGKADPGVWKNAVRRIMAEGADLTQLWNVGVRRRREANERGLTRWTDPRVTPDAVGIAGSTTAPKLRAQLEVNRDRAGPPVRPARIAAARAEWLDPPLEFYVDFETVGDLDDDFARFPERGGQPLIFMVGCGHVEAGQWRFECFIADRLDEPSEARAIDAWFAHMAAVRARLAPGSRAMVVHWSPHERFTLEEAFDAAVKRHPEKDWRHPDWAWFDFLARVVREEPVVVRGAHGFGLKAVANAMCDLGLIETRWDEGPVDGLGAMVGAWRCEREASRAGVRLIDTDLMKGIRRYNEVDCKVMMELVRHLRRHH